ncbi:MAG: hypothetical protein IJ347_03830 [Faecalibacterium sp.]|nr:hypothetical protein [Faecalibacterium sp.]
MTKNERDDFWLSLGPAAEYYGMPCEDTAAQNGDASPDGRLHGYNGAEPEHQNTETDEFDPTPGGSIEMPGPFPLIPGTEPGL